MTKPRRVIYLITRRCSERRFFLRPDARVTHVFEYVLAVLATRYAIEVHAFVVMPGARRRGYRTRLLRPQPATA